MSAWLIMLTIGLAWLGALVVWLVSDKRPRAQHALAVVFSAAAGLAALSLIPNTNAQAVIRLDMGGVFGVFTFVPDGLAVFLAIVATVIGSLAVIFSVEYMRGEAQLGRYYALVLLFIGSMAGLVLAGSLFLMFIFWEMTALCSYALISFYNDDPKAVRGGMKALIITQLGGIGLLLGTLAAYVYLGDYQIGTLLANAHTLPPGVLSFIAFTFLFAAMAKSAQVPFHTWLPDAMEAPTPVSALIHAATMVNAGVYLLARFYPAFAEVAGWGTAVLIIGLVTALLAALMAVVATDLKRVLAYSTVSQLGYMVYAIGVGGVFASQFHLFSHAVFKALLFLGAGAVIHAAGTRDMRQMGGLRRQMPLVSTVFIIGAAALAGLPILNGFWSKELILESGLEHGPLWAYIGMVLGAGITAFYTFRMVWLVFFGRPQSEKQVHDVGTPMKTALIPLALGTLTTWLLIGLFGEWLQATLPYHDLHVETSSEMLLAILTAPATWLALVVVALGLATWWQRDHLGGTAQALQGLGRAAANGFGFEALNRGAVNLTQKTAVALQVTQTGQLNWNVLGIVLALVVVLVLLAGAA
ncbi:MAG: NADH-quinone oxidoreductase subunit L [Chloroflexi bacterium]|nr:NADH-quinone oxidoreductase subunit L [Chloroflexota bacterium]